MASSGQRKRGEQRNQEQATYVALTGIFLGLFAAFSKQEQEKHRALDLNGLDLAMLGLSTFRTGRLLSYDKVTEPLREPFTETTPDAYGTSQTTAPEGAGAQRALGALLACPTCTGTWAAAFFVYGLRIAPGPTRLFLAFMSATGLAEILNSANEALSWTGSAERKQAKPSDK